MQDELNAEASPGRLPIRILGINERGQEVGNPGMSQLGSCPWLQDTEAQNVWRRWRSTWRDVVVLDAQNRKVTSFNLTSHNLNLPAEYAALKSILVRAATIAP